MQDKAYAYARAIEEYTQEGSGSKRLSVTTTFADDLVSQTRYDETGTSTTRYVQADGFGSTRLLTDETGAVTDAIDYDAFGNVIARTGATEIDHLYRGEALDPTTGFYYLRARYYDPNNARFLTQDTFAGYSSDPRSLHKYTYTHNDPVNGMDPSGRFTLTELSAASDIQSTLANLQADFGYNLIDAAMNRDSYDASSMGWSAVLSMLPGAVKGIASISRGLKWAKNAKVGRGWVKALDGASRNEIRVADLMADKFAVTVYVRGNSNVGKKINDLWVGGKRWELKEFIKLSRTSVSRNILEGGQQARRVVLDARAPVNGFDMSTLKQGVEAAVENSARYGKPMPSEVWAIVPGDELIPLWP